MYLKYFIIAIMKLNNLQDLNLEIIFINIVINELIKKNNKEK